MPLYEYQCDDCEHRFERIQKFSDDPVKTCPSCGGAVRKLLSSPAIQFKGTGWYITDYARKPAPGQPAAEGKKDEKTDSKKTESAKTSESGSKDASAKTSSSDSSKSTPSST